jgi:predicted transcriptional regulator
MRTYDQKITVSLTSEDKIKLEQLADTDRRTPQQMASIFVEDAIANLSPDSVDTTEAITDINSIEG